MKRIIQLVPGLPPMLNGVGDFSLVLARTLREVFDVTTHFAVCSPVWDGPGDVEGFAVTPMRRRDAQSVASQLDRIASQEGAHVTLVQLSPYGFDRNGAPLWLSHALRQWKRTTTRRSAVTYFHELFAMSAPWRKGFWLTPLQRLATARVARVSERLVTNRSRSAQWLARAAPASGCAVNVLPVLSGVGEPQYLPSTRARNLVLWGSGAMKTTLYARYAALLGTLVGKLGIGSVVDVGSGSAARPKAIGAAAVNAIGIAAPAQISEVLGNSLLGVVGYPPAMLGKSSIFAAFAAHRLPALVLDSRDAPHVLPDGLTQGTHLLTREDAADVSLDSLASIGRAAQAWYAEHDAHRHASLIAQLVKDLAPEKSR
ncbi:MAG TPA: hypothetical protein VN613_05795 [Gemmatimonadaceae bacterium]|nr:hypothetical protein [Gemmatimonadaceae bacterium]